MKLLFDIGNSRIKWAYAHNGQLLHQGSRVHRGCSAAAAVGFVAELVHVPDSAAAVNVGGLALEEALQRAVRARFAMDVQWVRTGVRYGEVLNGYASHEQLGADRWAAIVGAWQLLRRSVCVVDAGTAVTIDLLADNGRHLGGYIVPGLELMRSSLLRDTSDIHGFVRQSTGDVTTQDLLGIDTRSAVERGALFMLSAAIDQVARQFVVNPAAPPVVLTGGDAPQIAPWLHFPALQRPLLVLEGLSYLAAESRDA